MFAKLILLGLHSITITHANHLTEKSYARHVALAGYYEGMAPLLDSLAETLIGSGNALNFNVDTFYLTTSEDVIKMVAKNFTDNYNAFPAFTRAIVDEILNLCYGTAYKLENLK